MAAVSKGNLSACSVIINHTGVDINATDRNRETALFQAAKLNRIEICRLFLEDPEINFSKDNKNGQTPL